VVHGKTDINRVSKELTMLRQAAIQFYGEYNQDPHFIPQSRAHLFNQPLSATILMDRDSLDCWLSSVKEARLMEAMRQQIITLHKHNTIKDYFRLTQPAGKPAKQLASSKLFSPQFS